MRFRIKKGDVTVTLLRTSVGFYAISRGKDRLPIAHAFSTLEEAKEWAYKEVGYVGYAKG